MSQNWISKALTLTLVVLMVSSTLAPVASAGSPQTPTSGSEMSASSFDFQEPTTERESPNPSTSDALTRGDVSANVQSTTSLATAPFYATPRLQNLQVSVLGTSSNSNGTIKVPVQVKGTYQDGQYPWTIPVTVTVNSDGLEKTSIVYLNPRGEPRNPQDYRGNTAFTLQYNQDSTTSHTVSVTADSQVGPNTASSSQSISVNGANDRSDVTTEGNIRNDEVSEPANDVNQVTRYRATRKATGYLEDAAIPFGAQSNVSNFPNMRDSNGKYATFESYRDTLNVGTLTTNIQNGSSQTIAIRYRALEDDNVYVTPIDSTGKAIDNRYTLPHDPTTSSRCHQGTKSDVCLIRLNSEELKEVGQQGELILAYSADEETAINVFCQDVITGDMPDSGEVCGLGNVSSFSGGRILDIRAIDTSTGNVANEKEQLTVSTGTDVNIEVELANFGTSEVKDNLTLTPSDPVNYSVETRTNISLSPGATRTVTFTGYNIQKLVRFDATYNGNSNWVEATPNLGPDKPISIPGGPYIAPLNVTNEVKTQAGLQRQTLSEKPGSEWKQVGTAPSSATDNWTTYADNVPLIGTITGLENSNDNITYINNELQFTHNGSVTASDAYREDINDAKRQLPNYTNPSDWTLADIRFTQYQDERRKIDTDRPVGYGWKRVDSYGSVATGAFEVKEFRALANGSKQSTAGLVIDTEGNGWVKQDDVPPTTRQSGYIYTNTSTNLTAINPDWQRYRFVETREVLNRRSSWETRLQDEKYEPGGNWTFVTNTSSGQYKYIRPTTSTKDVWTYRRPVNNTYYTYKRPKTETTYEWKRITYEAQFVFEKTAATSDMRVWEGPLYQWVDDYESKNVELNGSRSYDQDLGKNLSSYQWNFEDGTQTRRNNSSDVVNRSYTTPFGIYKPELTVWSQDGEYDQNDTEVRVIPCEFRSCLSFEARPELNATAKRPAIDYRTQEIPYRVDFTGDLANEEWAINITAPKENASFKKEIWRGYDIVNNSEQIHGTINPRVNQIGPGRVELQVTANPTESGRPVRDTFEIYICEAGTQYNNSSLCNLDPDGDGVDNENDPEPYCNNRNILIENCTPLPPGVSGNVTNGYRLVPQEAKWDERTEWLANETQKHVMYEPGGRMKIGYSTDNDIQEKNYETSNFERGSRKGLVAYYPFEDGPLQDDTKWVVENEGPRGTPYNAQILVEAGSGNLQDYRNHASDTDYRSRAPSLGISGAFGSEGIDFHDTTSGYLSIISYQDTGDEGTILPGRDMTSEFRNSTTISFYAKGYQLRERNSDYKEAIWGMQNVESGALDQNLNRLQIHHESGRDELHSKWIGHNADTGNTFTAMTERDYGVGSMDLSALGDGGEWHHVSYVLQGGDRPGDSDEMRFYIDGRLRDAFSISVFRSSPSSYFTVNAANKPFGEHVRRFLFGGTWADINTVTGSNGLQNQLRGIKFDDLRIHNRALSSRQIRKNELIDDDDPTQLRPHGYMYTNPRPLNNSSGTAKSYNTSNGIDVLFDGTVPAGSENEVQVQVIPWKNGSPKVASSDTARFNSTGTERVTLSGISNVSNVSVRVSMFSESPAVSPTVDSVSVVAYENKSLTQPNEPPYAVMFDNSSSTTISTGETLRFNGSYSYDLTGNITQYEYRVEGPAGFGGASESGTVTKGSEIPDYTFELQCQGEHTVTLTVQDNFGEIDSKSATFNVSNQKPIANATPDTQTIKPGETAYFDGSNSYDPDGSLAKSQWYFEHADTYEYGTTSSFTYSSKGTYYVNHTVVDDGCTIDSERVRVNVDNTPPVADAGPDQTVNTGETVTFDGSGSYDPDNDSISYEWDFDADGTYDETGASPTHSYSTTGDKTVTLRVSDPSGATDTDTMVVTVNSGTTTSFDETFESYSLGSQGWNVKNDNSNDDTTVTDTRAYEGSQSLRSLQPNTGAPSHHHAWKYFGGAGSSTVSYSAKIYIEGKQNGGTADDFDFAVRSEQNTDVSGYKTAFDINFQNDGSYISVNDGGTKRNVNAEIENQWVDAQVIVDYSANTYDLYLDGSYIGTYDMPDSGRPGEFDYVTHRNDNYDGYIDKVVIEER